MMQDTGALKNQAFPMLQVQGDRCLEDWGLGEDMVRIHCIKKSMFNF